MARALIDVREILERARRTGDRREIEAAIERIASFTDRDADAVLIGEAATDTGLAQRAGR